MGERNELLEKGAHHDDDRREARLRLYEVQPRGLRLQERREGRLRLRPDVRLRRLPVRRLRLLQQGVRRTNVWSRTASRAP
jgi:hypothetical protein